MHVFVTGASGFIGGHVTRALLAAGHRVSALARSEAAAARVAALGAIPVRADLATLDAAHLARPEGAGGIEAVVHAAAFVEEYGTRAQFWSANVEGTTRVLDAARAAGVRRFVHIGTEAAFFTGGDLVGIDERAPYPERHRYLYPETKAEAERRVLAASRPGFTTVSLRPRLVWGPGDTSVLPAIRAMAAAGRWSWIDGGRHETSTTHVDTLVAAVLRALESDAAGAFFVADEGTVTLRAFLTGLAAADGFSLPDRSVPGWLARAAATLVEAAWRALRLAGPPPMVAFSTAMLSRTVTVDAARARAALGWAPVLTREEGLRQLAAAR